jgi:hypothetical protein
MIAASLLALSVDGRAEENDTKDFTIVAATDPATVKTTADANFTITITPTPPWVLKAETPLKVTLAPSEGVEVATAVLTAKHLDTATGSVRTGLAAKRTGQHTVAADMSFFLCKEDICQRFRHALKARFTAED